MDFKEANRKIIEEYLPLIGIYKMSKLIGDELDCMITLPNNYENVCVSELHQRIGKYNESENILNSFSPIELRYFIELELFLFRIECNMINTIKQNYFDYFERCGKYISQFFSQTLKNGDEKVYITYSMQKKVLNYRTDFMFNVLSTKEEPIFKFAVELDGHDFHEKTKEQSSKDKKRDRELLGLGIETLRFTGSDIFKDCEECIHETFEYISNRLLSL